MSKVFIEESTLTSIGDAIRSKTGETGLIAPLNMATAISNLATGGGNLQYTYLEGGAIGTQVPRCLGRILRKSRGQFISYRDSNCSKELSFPFRAVLNIPG